MTDLTLQGPVVQILTADPCGQWCLFGTRNGGRLVYPTPERGRFRVLRWKR